MFEGARSVIEDTGSLGRSAGTHYHSSLCSTPPPEPTRASLIHLSIHLAHGFSQPRVRFLTACLRWNVGSQRCSLSPTYLGSNLHFTCGHEVVGWDTSKPGRVTVQLDIGGRSSSGTSLPHAPEPGPEKECRVDLVDSHGRKAFAAVRTRSQWPTKFAHAPKPFGLSH